MYYRDGSRMLVVDVTVDSELRVGSPTVLFEGPYNPGPVPRFARANYDVSLDGSRFLMVSAAYSSLIFVHNWFEELKERVPVP